MSPVKPTEPEQAPAPDADASPKPARVAPGAWQRHLSTLTGWTGRQLGRPRTRLAVIGSVLLLIAVLGIISSVWTLPLVIVGVVMVLIAWIGARLDGRFAVEWGEGGTQLEFRAQIKAPPPARAALTAPAVPAPARRPAVRVPTLTHHDDSDVIEGEGHTVEIDVAELRALIVAAEAKEAGAADATANGAGDGAEQRDRPAA